MSEQFSRTEMLIGKENVEKLRNSKEYLEALKAGEEDKFLLEFLGKL